MMNRKYIILLRLGTRSDSKVSDEHFLFENAPNSNIFLGATSAYFHIPLSIIIGHNGKNTHISIHTHSNAAPIGKDNKNRQPNYRKYKYHAG